MRSYDLAACLVVVTGLLLVVATWSVLYLAFGGGWRAAAVALTIVVGCLALLRAVDRSVSDG